MSINLIAEEPSDVLLLKRVLGSASAPDVRLLNGADERGSAVSMGGTLASIRQEPVIILLDARSVDEENIEVQRENKEPLLSGFNELVFAVPELEVVLFHAPAMLERILGIGMTEEDRIEARYIPKKVLARLLERSGRFADTSALIEAIDDTSARCFAAHPLIQQLEALIADLHENPIPEEFRYLRTG